MEETSLVDRSGIKSIILSRNNIGIVNKHIQENNTKTVEETPQKVGTDDSNNKINEEWNIDDTNWSSLRLVSKKELDHLIQSYLVIHRPDGVSIVSNLSPLEVYSADNLRDIPHRRCSKKPPFFPKDIVGAVRLHIESDIDYYLDKANKSLHIAREHSGYFQEHSGLIPSISSLQDLCRAVVVHGEMDEVRGVGQFRCNIGNGGRNWENKTPCLLHGLQFEKDLIRDDRFNATQILKTIGLVTEFVWHVCNSMQVDASDNPLAGNKLRKQMYAM